jgi:hypothetical protein
MLAFWLAVQVLVVEPSHHHEDCKSHYDCAICLVTIQPPDVAVHFSPSTFDNPSYSELAYPHSRYTSKTPPRLKSRSPPAT